MRTQHDIALIAAYHAPLHRLTRCAGGYRNPQASTPVITSRTANRLHNAMLAEYNSRELPSCITLTPAGIAAALQILGNTQSRAA